MDEHAVARATSFRRDHLAWIVVRHFLSADLLEELGRALVDVVTRGERTLDDLFETTRTVGPSTLVAWVAQPRTVELTIDRALQALVRSLARTWDDRSTGDVTGVAAHEAESLKTIDTAFSVAHLDFDSLAPFRARGAPPDRLRVVTEALSLVASSPEGERRCVDDACHSLTSQFEAPLGAIVVKHLGDLCADVDRWHLASEFYARSQTLSAGEAEGHWSSLIDFLRGALSQSQASARWSLEGPAAASQAYDAIIRDAGPLNRPAWLLNVAVDAMSARMATRVGAPFRDHRAVVALGPQLLDTHDPGGALALWRGQDYWAAQDRFWAVLRRQTALGSALESRTTKALYGAAIVDALRAGLGRRLEPVTFRMGVRLLIEGGDEDAADRVAWVERLVAENLDPDLVSYALAHAHGAPGFHHDRMSVVLTLFKHWVLALPEGAASLSRTMLTSLATSAGATGGVDVARLSEIALNGLSKIAQARPEFLALASLEITAGAVSLIERGGLIGAGHALQFAFENMHAFGETELAALVRATLHRLRTFEPAQSPWPVVRPAIALLASRRVLTLCAGDEELKETVPATLVSFALGSDSEYASVMYLLRDLDPSWVHERVDVSRLKEVVGELRERAGQINSSRASEDVLALLVAPAISQADGVRDALDALRRMVSSAATDRPALAFERAYKPVMLAADARMRMADEARMPQDEVRDALDAVATSLLDVWEKAAEDPLVFAGFSIPPRSAPNSILVHNWTFASLGLARSLHRENEMAEALDLAARQPLLGDTIAMARAIRAVAGDPESLDVEAIREEPKRPFYASVGRRLIMLDELPEAVRGAVTNVLVDRCLRLGPNGLDAGIFLAAILQKSDRALSADDLRSYRQRLDNNEELRMGLSPLLHRIGGSSTSS